MNFRVWTQAADTKVATPHVVDAACLEDAVALVEAELNHRDHVVLRRHDVELQSGIWVSIEALVEFALNADTGAVYRGLVSRMSRGLWRPNEAERPLLERILHRSCLRLG